MKYVILQRTFTSQGTMTEAFVLEVCTSLKKADITMKQIANGCFRRGYIDVSDPSKPKEYGSGIIDVKRFKTEMGFEYEFQSIMREDNVKWGNFPF